MLVCTVNLSAVLFRLCGRAAGLVVFLLKSAPPLPWAVS